MKRVTSPYIVKKRSRVHNAGIFARKDIPTRTHIIEYVGEKITKAESDRRGTISLQESKKNKKKGAVYLFELNKRYDLDGDVAYNTAKHINHSCYPNCEAYISRGHIWIVALRNIKKGEELTYNYGYDFDDYKEHKCNCGSGRCVGYILAKGHWPKLKNLREFKKKS